MVSLASVAVRDRFSAVGSELRTMDDDADLLAPFADDVVATAVDDVGAGEVSVDDIRAALAAHQHLVRDLRSVDGLVFEYRKEFVRDPVVDRDDDALYLVVPPRVWPEFGDALALDADVLAVVRAVHERVVGSVVDGGSGPDGEGDDDRDAMVLARE